MCTNRKRLYQVVQIIVKCQMLELSSSLTWDYMGVKVSNDIACESMHQICSSKFIYIPEVGLQQIC